MRCLELFSGTGSIGRAFERLGWEVVSLDINPEFTPTHVADILSWNHHVYKRDYFDFVWASPVCTQYSIARTTGPPRDLLSADRLVERALLIMSYFGSGEKACHWAFENPQSGLLKTRSIVAGLPFFDTSYCRYDYQYRKTTRIWSSLALCLRKPCSPSDPCSAMVGKRHPMTAQQGRRGSDPNDGNNRCSQRELYRIPDGLCDAIAEAANLAVDQRDEPTPGAPASAPVRQAPGELRGSSRDM
jgi:hypothetical protein